jgi:peptidoglycan/LPS O-acetylase OafA/YrhL
LLPGGFAGVDIFFVISGFLITNIIWREQLESKFSLSNFYARRVRRIFPALILVLTACVVFGWFILFEDEYKQLGNHTLRASVFLINFQLWKESGYFDAQAELKPLLHLWSLSIEEQFYIFWPLLLGLLIRYCRRPHFWLCTIFAVSYIWNIYQSLDDPAQNFYSPLTRFWELTAGGLLAISLPLLRERIGRKSQCIIGLVGIIVLIFCYVKNCSLIRIKRKRKTRVINPIKFNRRIFFNKINDFHQCSAIPTQDPINPITNH